MANLRSEQKASQRVSASDSVETKAVELLLDCLEREGVGYVFGNPGTSEQGFMAALSMRPSLSYVLGLHETVAVAMAEGYARATGVATFVNLHTSVGLANGLSQIHNAMVHRSPVVVTAGQSESDQLLYEPSLSADTVAMARQFTKWSYELHSPSDIEQAIRRAFKVALDPPAGPVFLSLPIDLLEEPVPTGEIGAGHYSYASLCPDAETLARAVRLIVESKHLALLCGDDVGRCGALRQAVALAEITGAEVYSLNQSQLGFPNDHDQFIRTLNVNDPKTPDLLSRVDLAVIVGAPAFSQLLELESPLLPSDAAVIHIDESSWETGKNVTTTIGMASDLGLTLSALSEQVAAAFGEGERKRAQVRRTSLHERKIVAEERQRERTATAMSKKSLTSLALMTTVQRSLGANYIVVEEATSSAGALSQAFQFSREGSLFSNRGGALGWALPAATGIKLAHPEATVVAVIGDGAANYSIQALWTAAHYGIAVKVLICNNREYRVLRTNLARFLPSFDAKALVGMDLIDPPIEFSQLARAYGIYGNRFEGSPAQLPEVVDAWLQTDGPALLEVLVDLGAKGK